MGMYHCPVCSCMVLAGQPHYACIDPECPYYDEEARRWLETHEHEPPSE